MTLFSEKCLFPIDASLHGFMPNLHKKSQTFSNTYTFYLVNNVYLILQDRTVECKSSNSKIEPAGHKSEDFIIGFLGRISDEYEEIQEYIC